MLDIQGDVVCNTLYISQGVQGYIQIYLKNLGAISKFQVPQG